MEIWRTSDVVPFPPRSRYASLEPIGLGTGMVESLTSYITRLARAKSLPPWVLVTRDVAPRFRRMKVASGGHCDLFAPLAVTLNGPCGTAEEAVRILSELTLHTGLRALTLTDLAGLVSHSGLLHSSEHWCPACLEDQRERGLEIGIPLVWQLRAVQVCPTHEVPLEHSCPRCGRRHRPLSRHGDSGRCPWCQTWLGGPGRVETLAGTSPADPELTAFMARESEYLLEQRKRLEAGSAFAENVRRLWIWRGGSLAAYAREVGHHAETVRLWMEGRQTPRWVAVLVVAFRFGLHAIDLLTAPVEGGVRLGGRPAHAGAVRKLKPVLNKHHPAELERHLQSVLGSELRPPISLAAAGRQVGCHSSFLKRKFPELAAKISERHRNYWSTSKQQRLFFARIVTQAKASEIAARGEYPSQRKVARLLPAEFDLRMPEVREALDDTLREWGFMAPRGEAREASRWARRRDGAQSGPILRGEPPWSAPSADFRCLQAIHGLRQPTGK